MSRAAPAAALTAIGLVSIAALVWAGSGGSDELRVVQPAQSHLARAYPAAAAAAFGRRVLVVHASGDRFRGEVFESARSGGGWELYGAMPPGAPRMSERLGSLAARGASELQSGQRFTQETETDLARHAVATIVIEDGKQIVGPREELLSGRVARDPNSGGLRVAGAELVWRSTAESEEIAPVLDPTDGLWGGAVTVDAAAPGTFRFCWPREGAHVTVDGRETTPAAGADDVFIYLDLPAGRSRVEVSYVDAGMRAFAAISGAAGIVLSLIGLLLLLRPRLSHDQVE